ncbi:MAG: hypothetical protein AVDCRST_MAG74-2766 [uncultured Pyrinomonadaceae bacterium]|uniref:Uncharacterized protein n=1 Tax=uncultured Pyrinomonadaceae bacterium TaxID=2283094 RepID=A0A6J4PDZ8_9BACT|nr:MAG: hypothetical protein AVDCRST_MAG74-2766 [uncultured Pyrinomonadaceae bacterium]
MQIDKRTLIETGTTNTSLKLFLINKCFRHISCEVTGHTSEKTSLCNK